MVPLPARRRPGSPLPAPVLTGLRNCVSGAAGGGGVVEVSTVPGVLQPARTATQRAAIASVAMERMAKATWTRYLGPAVGGLPLGDAAHEDKAVAGGAGLRDHDAADPAGARRVRAV